MVDVYTNFVSCSGLDGWFNEEHAAASERRSKIKSWPRPTVCQPAPNVYGETKQLWSKWRRGKKKTKEVGEPGGRLFLVAITCRSAKVNLL